jgi:pyridinium-3,5-bisthiocarboxylic acid mononucleotide nickel chelatase
VRTLWVDAGSGAAGDMLLAALLDAGADLRAVRDGLRSLPVEPVDLELTEVRRHGLRAMLASVRAPRSGTGRNLAAVTSAISAARLAGPVHGFAVRVFGRLARAEARVHGVSPDAVHFHEVGALDAIADVVGCALALHSLDLLADTCTRVVSPVAAGHGSASTAHGRLPVPVPAVLELLAGARAPIAAHPAGGPPAALAEPMELCTPTGAALLCELATGWGPVPACTPLTTGTGAGRADPAGHPNVLRVLTGETAATPGWAVTGMCRVDATIDDLDPRLWPDVLESLRAAGAADAWCSPALMRKGRPGQVLSILVEPQRLDAVCQMTFEQTTTLGVRISEVQRRSLRRDQVEVTLAGMPVSVKRGHLGDRIVTVQPEYEDVRAAARQSGRPVADLTAEARRAATEAELP